LDTSRDASLVTGLTAFGHSSAAEAERCCRGPQKCLNLRHFAEAGNLVLLCYDSVPCRVDRMS
jgi:hypothetical protein